MPYISKEFINLTLLLFGPLVLIRYV